MIRPATPLTVLLFAAFALLLLSVLSTPIIKGIPLGTVDDVQFGVFGYCVSQVQVSCVLFHVLSGSHTDNLSVPASLALVVIEMRDAHRLDLATLLTRQSPEFCKAIFLYDVIPKYPNPPSSGEQRTSVT